jgi:hypothetical protein
MTDERREDLCRQALRKEFPMKTVCLASLCAFAWAVLIAAPAAAQESTHVTTTSHPGGYTYAFDDDPMQAGGLSASFPRIVVRERAGGGTLIRPRTQFVAELLKTVESI